MPVPESDGTIFVATNQGVRERATYANSTTANSIEKGYL